MPKTIKIKTEYEKMQETLGVEKYKVCDRCGNDLSKGGFVLHLPFKKQYVELCNICQYGLMFSYYSDIKRDLLK